MFKKFRKSRIHSEQVSITVMNNNQEICKMDNIKETELSKQKDFLIKNDDNINKKLPQELLLRIFSFLDIMSLCRCAQVSNYWNNLALDGSNWQKVDLFEFQAFVEHDVVVNLSRRCGGFLKSL